MGLGNVLPQSNDSEMFVYTVLTQARVQLIWHNTIWPKSYSEQKSLCHTTIINIEQLLLLGCQ